MDSEIVPSSLADIAPILRVANEIESGSPRVAYLCRFYAFEKAHRLDPTSHGSGVRQYKTALLQRLERWDNFFHQDATTSRRRKISDAAEIQEFYGRYYWYIRGLENADNADSTRLRKAYQTALILFEVLKAVTLTEAVEVKKEVLEACSNVIDRAKTLDLDGSNQAPLSHPEIKHPNDLKIPLEVIKDCTQDFNERNLIGKGGYGRVYKGIISWAYNVNQLVAVKRLDVTGLQGNKEFHTELTTLSQYKHDNIIKLIGFCDDGKEMILVYEYATHGSIDNYLRNPALSVRLSWLQLLNICIGVASALDYLHNHVAEKHRIIHRDIKSANILLDENWRAKLADFGLARIGLANQRNTFVITNLAGTHGYCDPQYERTGILTKESDVYSFGVVLFEVLCGRLAYDFKYNDERRFLHHLARTCYKNGELDMIIDHRIKKDIKPKTLLKFSDIAYQCLHETREERPTIAEVLFQLTEAMEIQLEDEILQDEVYEI